MLFKEMLTDELTDLREVEHSHRNYELSDLIRDELDSRGSFVIDTAKGQEVYHMGIEWSGRRKDFLKDIKNIDQKFKR